MEGEQISQLIAGYIDIILKKVLSLSVKHANISNFSLLSSCRRKPRITSELTEMKSRLCTKTASHPSSKLPFWIKVHYNKHLTTPRATTIRQQSSKVGHANMGSVALPAVLRAGESAQNQFTTGSMQKAQFSQVSDQAHAGGQLSMAVSVPACTHPVLILSCFHFYLLTV